MIQLNYLSNAYKVPIPTQDGFDLAEQPKIKLIFRGYIIDHVPSPVVVLETDKTDWTMVTLVCRGYTFNRKIHLPQPYQKPRAINWRWQLA
jgi:hypothetical protein